MMQKSGILEIDGYKLRYHTEGEGPDVLIVGTAQYYPNSFSKELKKHFKLTFIDWRGFSETGASSNLTFDTLLDDIEMIRKQLRIKQCVIIGHSANALYVLEYAKKYPDAVSHVVMIAVSPSLNAEMSVLAQHYWEEIATEERKTAFQKRIEKMPDAELNKLPPSERFIAWYIRRDPQAWYNFHFDSSWLWKDIHINMPVFDFFYGVALRDIDISDGLENFNKPVFLALGRYDFIVAPPTSWDEVKSKFKKLTIKIFEKSGHSPQYEEAALFDQTLLDWIRDF